MFSQTVEYALRGVIFLATQDAPCSTDDIARATQVPRAYLSKVLQRLREAGIVHSQRGAGGGVRLARPAAELTLFDVVDVVEPIQRIKTCPLGLRAHGVRLCPLHRRLDDAMAEMEKAFRDTTLAEILAEPTDSPPLCEIDTPEPLDRSGPSC